MTSAGRRIPRPRQVEVWLPGPGGGVAAVENVETEPVLRSVGYQRLMLSACHPLYSAAQRVIVFARLARRERSRVRRS